MFVSLRRLNNPSINDKTIKDFLYFLIGLSFLHSNSLLPPSFLHQFTNPKNQNPIFLEEFLNNLSSLPLLKSFSQLFFLSLENILKNLLIDTTFWKEYNSFFNQFIWELDEFSPDSFKITPSIFEYVYEKDLTDPHSSGTYYTPPKISHYIADQTIVDYLTQKINKKYSSTYSNFEIDVLNMTKITSIEKEQIEYCLLLLKDLSICDNACGSGAFLLAAIIVLERLYQKITVLLSLQSSLTNLYREYILQKNLYGVDLEPRAIQTTKIRLWIHGINIDSKSEFKGKPFIFHLQVGNTLIGKIQNSKKNQNNQLFEEAYTKALFEEIFEKVPISNELTRFREILPFHWILHFPEIMDRGGFDIIIGNPPYIRHEKVKHLTDSQHFPFKTILQKLYTPYDSQFDLALFFLLRSISLLKPGGFHSYIITSKWLRAKYGQKIKEIFLSQITLKKIIDLTGINNLFGAVIDTMIYLVEKSVPNPDLNISYNHPQTLSELLHEGVTKSLASLNSDQWVFLPSHLDEIWTYISHTCVPLKSLSVKLYRGITTGFNRAFIISTEQKNSFLSVDPFLNQYIHPVILGEDLSEFSCIWGKNWIIVFPEGSTSSSFPTEHPILFSYFTSFKDQLHGKGKGIELRDDQGQFWWELRTCDYYSEFVQPKLVWQRVTKSPRFFLDLNQFYLLDSTACLRAELPLMKLFQILFTSSFFQKFIVKYQVHQYGQTGFLLSNQYLQKFPIPKIPDHILFEYFSDYLNFLSLFPQLINYYSSLDDLSFLDNWKKLFLSFTDALVFELYFSAIINSTQLSFYPLQQSLMNKCVKINFEAWNLSGKNLILQIPNQELLSFQQMTKIILNQLTILYDFLLNDPTINTLKDQIFQHSWIRAIQNN